MNGPSDTAGVRARNAGRMLAEIRRRGETSRVDLVDALGLSPATVSAVTSNLLETGLIRETTALATPGRGRPRLQLTLNAGARHVAGAKLNNNAITVAILDFAGEILADASVTLERPHIEAAAMVEKLMAAFHAVLAKTEMTEADIAAFGFGVPGFIDIASGICHWSPVLKGAPLDIRALLAGRLSCPIFVDNDANLVTLAELWFGHGRDVRDFLVVTVEHGVGMGVVIDGQIYRGARGLGAEFGHTKVQIDGALCRCGQRGCLEAYVADFALLREAGAALDDLDGTASPGAILDRLAQQAGAGHEAAASIYRRSGRMLGLGVANLCNLFDPELVVLSGTQIQNHHLLAEEMERTIVANSIVASRPATPLAVHRWGDSLWARGAGALALDGLMSTIDLANTGAEDGGKRVQRAV